MILYREKLYNGMVDIRDYEVNQALKTKKEIRVVVGKDYMDLSLKKLKRPLKKSEIMRSLHYPDQYYRLYSYLWKPEKKLSEEEHFKQAILN